MRFRVRANRSVLRWLPVGQAPRPSVLRLERALQQTNDLVYRHSRRTGIASRPTKSQQEAAMPSNAIAHFAEAGEVNKKPLLEERRDRGVQIGRLREQPEFAHDQRGVRGRAEKIRNKAKARCDLTFKVFLAGISGFRIWKKRNYRHGSHHPHESTKHTPELKAGSVQNCTPCAAAGRTDQCRVADLRTQDRAFAVRDVPGADIGARYPPRA